MKDARLYLEKIPIRMLDEDIIEQIQQAQKDSYNQAIEDAANNVTLLEEGIDTESQRYTIESNSNYYSEVEIDINKDSIIKLKIECVNVSLFKCP